MLYYALHCQYIMIKVNMFFKRNDVLDAFEEDDIIIPKTFWGELQYIWFICGYIKKYPDKKQKELISLIRQIAFFKQLQRPNKFFCKIIDFLLKKMEF